MPANRPCAAFKAEWLRRHGQAVQTDRFSSEPRGRIWPGCGWAGLPCCGMALAGGNGDCARTWVGLGAAEGRAAGPMPLLAEKADKEAFEIMPRSMARIA
ncbi:MAG TPA: hypothetical protein VGC80_11695 [Acetobacteraceae bacterium]